METRKAVAKFNTALGLTEPTSAQRARLEGVMSNWIAIHEEITNYDGHDRYYDKLRKMMWVELNREEGPRAHIMTRLLGRYQNLRRQQEYKLLEAAVPAVSEANG